MLARLRMDAQLFIDLVYSFLRWRGYLKRKPIRFWHYEVKEGVKFKLRRGVWDSAVIIETWRLNEYLRNLKGFREGAIVIDIGAHVGSFSIFVASKLKKIKVFAFEPDPDNFALLKENIEINHLGDKVFPFRLALANEGKGKVKLDIYPDNPGSHSTTLSSRGLHEGKEKMSFEVETISLKEVFEKNRLSKCDFLKMDCEGCEYSVLLSTPKSILRKIESLTLEYHRGGNIEEIRRYLKQAGFKTKFDRAIPNRIVGWIVKAPLLSAWREN